MLFNEKFLPSWIWIAVTWTWTHSNLNKSNKVKSEIYCGKFLFNYEKGALHHCTVYRCAGKEVAIFCTEENGDTF